MVSLAGSPGMGSGNRRISKAASSPRDSGPTTEFAIPIPTVLEIRENGLESRLCLLGSDLDIVRVRYIQAELDLGTLLLVSFGETSPVIESTCLLEETDQLGSMLQILTNRTQNT